jgi:3-oxoacyl-[acyl-carrier protein] reductase
MFDLTGNVAVVTGSSRGIGRAIAIALARQGAKVVVNYVSNPAAAEAVVEQITSAGGEACAIQADVSDPEQARRLIDATLAAYGQLDILVNNAGITRDGLLLRMSENDWDVVLDTNLKGAFNCMKAAAKPMMRARRGRIISISSVSGIAGNAGQANYSAAKAGLHGLTKAVARELGSRQITVNAVAPGFVATDLTAHLDEKLLAAGVEHTVLGRMGHVDDIAAAVLFLASDEASFITGQIIAVDGGLAL